MGSKESLCKTATGHNNSSGGQKIFPVHIFSGLRRDDVWEKVREGQFSWQRLPLQEIQTHLNVCPPDHRSPDMQHTYILLPAKPLGLAKLYSRSLGWQRSVGILLCPGKHHPVPCSGCEGTGLGTKLTCFRHMLTAITTPNTTHPFCKGPTVLNSSIPGPPIGCSWGLTPVNVCVRFNLITSFQAFTTSPV